MESRERSIIKAIGWRIIAVCNSFFVLVIEISDSALMNAIYMNVTGFMIYYFYERFLNRILCGKIIK
jgi:hypothetical protein